ncbi:MAG: amino acid permease [Alphaproteobacteria bacterium]|nr:amino acid permease [Alphaproteobacteria bacterium]
MNYFKRKSIESVREGSKNAGFAKTLTAFDLIIFGLGAIIGTGVFAVTGVVAAQYAGPAVTVSYAIAGFTCIFVALAYTELAAMLPTSGSVYTYSFVAFGELAAWLTGSILILELCFGASTVSSAWSGYLQGILESAGIILPKVISTSYSQGGFVNCPAIFITLVVGSILYRGTKDSKRVNTILVFIKMAAITAFILSAIPYFDLKHWDNFMPFGFDNVLMGSSILFFSFTGFGSLASLADECKNPKKDLMIGIIGSLLISTAVYVVVGALATGIVPYFELNNAQPLAQALRMNGNNLGSIIVATGAVCGMTTVVMMNIYAQSRIFYTIAKDGLLPSIFTQTQKGTGNPQKTIIFFTVLTALLSGFIPFELLSKLSSMGALLDYIIISVIVIIFRFTYPTTQRPFKCPGLFVVAPVAILASGYLLSKQIFDHDWSILFTGQILGLYLLAALVVYGIKQFSPMNSAPQNS